MNFLNLNGSLIPANQPVWMRDNRSFRYGDGLFETIKVYKGQLLLGNYHFERFFGGLEQLQFPLNTIPSPAELQQQVLDLCEQNNCLNLARVRLSISRGNGSIGDFSISPEYLIESWPLDLSVNDLNKEGLTLGLYTEAKKSCDAFSHLKSASALHYVMAAKYAKENGYNDCVILNQHGRIAESTIANIFLIIGNDIITPGPTEGAVAGVLSRHLLVELNIIQQPVTIQQMEQADEVFLTNAIQGIRWVKQFGSKSYNHQRVAEIYRNQIQTMYR